MEGRAFHMDDIFTNLHSIDKYLLYIDWILMNISRARKSNLIGKIRTAMVLHECKTWLTRIDITSQLHTDMPIWFTESSLNQLTLYRFVVAVCSCHVSFRKVKQNFVLINMTWPGNDKTYSVNFGLCKHKSINATWVVILSVIRSKTNEYMNWKGWLNFSNTSFIIERISFTSNRQYPRGITLYLFWWSKAILNYLNQRPI